MRKKQVDYKEEKRSDEKNNGYKMVSWDREQKLPCVTPISKPKRDYETNYRSVSLNKSILMSNSSLGYGNERKIKRMEKDIEEYEIERQTNILYSKHFSSLANMLGNQQMEFEEMKLKIEELINCASKLYLQPVLENRLPFSSRYTNQMYSQIKDYSRINQKQYQESSQNKSKIYFENTNKHQLENKLFHNQIKINKLQKENQLLKSLYDSNKKENIIEKVHKNQPYRHEELYKVNYNEIEIRKQLQRRQYQIKKQYMEREERLKWTHQREMQKILQKQEGIDDDSKKQKIHSLQNQISILTQQLFKIQRELQNSNNDKIILQKEINYYKSRNNKFINDSQLQYQSYSNKINEIQQNENHFLKENKMLNDQCELLNKKCLALQFQRQHQIDNYNLLKLDNNALIKEINQLQMQYQNAKTEQNYLKDQKNEHNQEIMYIKNQLQNLKQQIKRGQFSCVKCAYHIQNQKLLQKKIQFNQKEKIVFEKQIFQTKQTLKNKQVVYLKIKKLNQENKKQIERIKQLYLEQKIFVKQLLQKNSQTVQNLQQLKKELQKINQLLNQKTQKLKIKTYKYQQLQDQHTKNTQLLYKATKQSAILQQQLIKVKEQSDELKKEFQQLQTQIITVDTQSNKLKQQYNFARQQAQKISQEAIKFKNKTSALHQQVKLIKQQRDKIRQEAQLLRSQSNVLKEELQRHGTPLQISKLTSKFFIEESQSKINKLNESQCLISSLKQQSKQQLNNQSMKVISFAQIKKQNESKKSQNVSKTLSKQNTRLKSQKAQFQQTNNIIFSNGDAVNNSKGMYQQNTTQGFTSLVRSNATQATSQNPYLNSMDSQNVARSTNSRPLSVKITNPYFNSSNGKVLINFQTQSQFRSTSACKTNRSEVNKSNSNLKQSFLKKTNKDINDLDISLKNGNKSSSPQMNQNLQYQLETINQNPNKTIKIKQGQNIIQKANSHHSKTNTSNKSKQSLSQQIRESITNNSARFKLEDKKKRNQKQDISKRQNNIMRNTNDVSNQYLLKKSNVQFHQNQQQPIYYENTNRIYYSPPPCNPQTVFSNNSRSSFNSTPYIYGINTCPLQNNEHNIPHNQYNAQKTPFFVKATSSFSRSNTINTPYGNQQFSNINQSQISNIQKANQIFSTTNYNNTNRNFKIKQIFSQRQFKQPCFSQQNNNQINYRTSTQKEAEIYSPRQQCYIQKTLITPIKSIDSSIGLKQSNLPPRSSINSPSLLKKLPSLPSQLHDRVSPQHSPRYSSPLPIFRRQTILNNQKRVSLNTKIGELKSQYCINNMIIPANKDLQNNDFTMLETQDSGIEVLQMNSDGNCCTLEK